MPGTNVEREKSVLTILENLKGTEPLKQLFWSELNYDRVNRALSRRGWGDVANNALANDPVLFATGANDFQVIHARLKSEKLLMGQERPVVSRLLQDHPYALFIFSNQAQDRWHFLNVKYDDEVQKRRVFRRITVGPEERLRTASERLSMLDLESIGPDIFRLSPLQIQQRHDEAFDVEAVTNQFFDTFAALYQRVADEVSALHGLEGRAGRLAQTLMDRMLFLYFIQKKGWLNGERDYLYSRFRRHWAANPNSSSFYSEVLYPLFLTLSDGERSTSTLGSVPFLNGGLFEESSKLSQAERLEQARLRVSNAAFKSIFHDLLERFNFTVTEDTPLDAEVAIDPEMLGKTFESLVLQLEKEPEKDLRKLTGSYYTPRAIVHFMCQESLKQYLSGQLRCLSGRIESDPAGTKLSALLTMPPADQLDGDQLASLKNLFSPAEAKNLRELILNCRICDPAVGSGAFPVGMLHEMVGAVARLDICLHDRPLKPPRNYDFDLKKRVIESCLYGVDIQEQAVRLCELRLWLALVVDYELDPEKTTSDAIRDVPSLPNLSYRIVRGDSLLERLFGSVIHLEQLGTDAVTKSIIESIQADKQAFFRESSATEKQRLQLKILGKQAGLAERLIQEQLERLVYQDHIFGEHAMSASQKEGQEDLNQRKKQLESLANKVRVARTSINALLERKARPPIAELDELRRKYFQTGDDPSFIWRVDFAEVFREKGGFDIVIANPPYISFGLRGNKAAKAEWMDAIKRFYPRSAEYKVSMYAVFMDCGLIQTNTTGVFCYITPDSFLLGRYFSKLRKRILDSCRLNRFVMFEDDFWESGVVGRPTITLVSRASETQGSSQLTTATLCKTVQQFLRSEWQQYSYPQAYFEGTSYSRFRLFFSETDMSFVGQMEEGATPLSSVVRFASGLIGKNGQDDIVADRKLGPTWGRGIESGGDVLPYKVQYAGKWMNFDKDVLKSGFRDAEYQRPKLFLRQTGDRLTAAYDEDGLYCLNNVHVGNVRDSHIDPRYVVGLLNSSLMNRYYRLISLETDRAMAQTDIDVMHELPFKSPTGEQHKQVVKLVSILHSRANLLDKDVQGHRKEIEDVLESVHFGNKRSATALIQG